MKIRSVIVDDESASREVLREMLTMYYPMIDIIAEAASVDEGVEVIRKSKPSLLFLDVELGRHTSFEILEKVDVTGIQIIFTTAHEGYALRAIKFAALDYLLKPVSREDLGAALEKITTRNIQLGLHELRDLFRSNLDQASGAAKRIVLSYGDHLEVVPVSEIIRCESEDNYTTFFLREKRKIVVSQTLKTYEEMLSDSGFCRVHHSHLINMAHVKGYTKGDGGTALMVDGSLIDVSRRKKEEFLRRLTSV